MVLGRLSWIGIATAAFGWLVMVLGDASLAKMGLWADPIYVVGVGQGLILTGIGLAIIDALHQGFGALNRFFEAVLQRSSARAPAPAAATAPAPPTQPPPRPGAEPVQTPPTASKPPRYQPPPAAPEPESEIVERGRINDRAYLLYADGSVEVETLLGVRRFADLAEAREFIGS